MVKVTQNTWKEVYVTWHGSMTVTEAIELLEKEGYEVRHIVACGVNNNDVRVIGCKSATMFVAEKR